MIESVMPSLIAAASSLLVCVVTNLLSSNRQSLKLEAQLDKQTALINLELKTLSERVEKHNSVIERTFVLEQKTAVQEEQIKVANHRIDDLEKHEDAHRSDGK